MPYGRLSISHSRGRCRLALGKMECFISAAPPPVHTSASRSSKGRVPDMTADSHPPTHLPGIGGGEFARPNVRKMKCHFPERMDKNIISLFINIQVYAGHIPIQSTMPVARVKGYYPVEINV